MSDITLKQVRSMRTISPARIKINPKTVLAALCMLSVVLVLISFVGVVVHDPYSGNPYTGDPAASTPTNMSKVILRFDVMAEGNIPSWYSGALLLIAAVLIAVIAADPRTRHEKYHERWAVLAVLFVLFSLDEIAYLHEGVNNFLSQQEGGFLTIGWILPAAVFVLIAGLWFAPFILSLPQKTKRLFIIAAAIFLTGALGLEVVDNFLVSDLSVQAPIVLISNHLQDLLEMSGTSLFIYALLSHIGAHLHPLRLAISQNSQT